MVKQSASSIGPVNGDSSSTIHWVIQDVAFIVATTPDIDEMYEKFTSRVKEVVDFDRLFINVLNLQTGHCCVHYSFPTSSPDSHPEVPPSGEGTQAGLVVATGQSLVRYDIAVDRGFIEDQDDLKADLRSAITVPLMVKGKAIGSVALRSGRVEAYGPEEQSLLERLADLIAPAVENATLYQQLQEHMQEMALVDEVARIITSTLDIDQVYERFAREMKKLLDFDRVYLNVADLEAGTYVIKYAAGWHDPDRLPGQVKPLEGSQTEYVMKLGKPLCRADIEQECIFTSDVGQLEWGARSSIGVPLISKGQPIGIMALRSRKVGAYGPREQAIVERLASQIAPAVENAELYQRRKEAEAAERLRTQEMEALYTIARMVTQPGSFEDKCHDILNVVVRAAQSEAGSIRVAAEDGQNLYLVAAVNPYNVDLPPSATIRRGEGVAGAALEEGQTAVVNNYPAYVTGTQRGKARGIGSCAALPVMIGTQTLGVINVVSGETGHFTPERVRLLSAIADGLGMLLENCRLSQDLRATTEEIEVVDGVARIITSTLEIDQVCEEFAQEMRKLVDFDRASISMVDHDSSTLKVQYTFGDHRPGMLPGATVPLEDTMTGAVAATGQTVVRGDISGADAYSDDQDFSAAGLRACIALPLVSKGRVIGSMILRSRAAHAYGPEERVILERLARQIAPAIENAQLYDQARREKELTSTTLAQIRAILAGVDSGILLVGNQQETLLANHRYGEFFGIDDVESLALTHPRLEDRWELIARSFADPQMVLAERSGIYAETDYSGSTREIELVYPVRRVLQPFTGPVYDEEGDCLGRLWVYHDVTEARAAEERLLQFQKIESIGRLAGGIAHDFNNLLTAIMGYSQLAMMEAPSNGNLCSHVQEIQRASERAANLTTQLLAFSRRQVVEPKVINLNDLIMDLDRLLRRLIGEHIELVTLPSPDIGLVKVDPGQIEQVLVNLVVNARDAMPSGGKLVIETAAISLDAQLAQQHVDAAPGSYITLSVSDNGSGMGEEAKAHLFEPFFTTKEVGKGTGLGLATCYGIVKQNGGYITVESQSGRGTTVTVGLPCETDAVKSSPSEGPAHGPTRGTETILLAEDDPLVRGMVSNVLDDHGYTVLQAGNGDEALRLAREQGDQRIDLLLSDIVMPQMGGLELAEHIQQLRPEVKIILTSGYSDEPVFRNATADSRVEFIQKPFIPAALASKVREVLDRSG